MRACSDAFDAARQVSMAQERHEQAVRTLGEEAVRTLGEEAVKWAEERRAQLAKEGHQ
jgi:hypothetical protein